MSSDRTAPTQLVGDELAGFVALFEAERASLVHLAVLLVDSHELAEEIVQDAFSAAADRWGRLDRPGAYVRTCVVNGSRGALRRREVRRRLTPVAAASPIEMPPELVELHDVLRALPDRQRMVVVLRYLHDLPDHEIAEAIGCRPAATVRSLAVRALRTLRRDLA